MTPDRIRGRGQARSGPGVFPGTTSSPGLPTPAGDPAEVLVLGRDLHWASGGLPGREVLAGELLGLAYRALDRPALAGIAGAHHRHRSLPRVDVLRGDAGA